MHFYSWKKARGFTLIELLVVITIGAILLTIAVPSFREILINNRLRTQINDFVSALNLTRSEAVKRGVTVSVCKSSDNANCGGAGVNWDTGWIVFVNSDNDSPAAVDAGETILHAAPALISGYTLRGDSNLASYISYRSTGEGNATGRFVLCENSTLTHARAVFINSSGRIYLAQDNNQNGIPEEENGADIASCTP